MSEPFWKQLGFESEKAQRDYEVKLLGDGVAIRPPAVSDAMVERALEGYDNAFQSPGGSHEVAMRAALAAALGVEG